MTQFKINNHEWAIGFMNPDDPDFENELQVACGYTNYINNVITINPMMRESQTKTTIIHELTHAFRWSYGFVNDVDPVKATVAEIDETIANFMESYAEAIINLANSLYISLDKERNGNKKGTSKKS